MDFLDVLLLLIGLYFLYGILFKPDIFWNRRRILRTREVMGDNRTMWMYGILGVIMVATALIGAFGVLG